MQAKASIKFSLLIIAILVTSFLIAASITNVLISDGKRALHNKNINGTTFVSNRNISGAMPTLPIRIFIPKISVNAPIVYVGVTSDGAIDVPNNPSDTAWYDEGALPGEIGDAVIVGHQGWKDHIRAVFDDLNLLRSGDLIYVKDDRGAITTFVVREVRVYDAHEDTKDVFGSTDGKAHLNLITCGGTWDKVMKSYPRRLVVFASS